MHEISDGGTPCSGDNADIYLGSLVRLLQSMCHLIWCPGHSVRGSRPVNMDFSDDFGGGGRIYTVCSLIISLIITVTELLDCSGCQHWVRSHILLRNRSLQFFYISTYLLLPFWTLWLIRNCDVLFLNEIPVISDDLQVYYYLHLTTAY
jgi:hypothetical protein